MTKSTMVELVEELKALPDSTGIRFMIQEALAGEYHDYKNNKYLCGKMESSARLRDLGFPDLAERIEQGEFDEEADEDDRKKMVEYLRKSGHPTIFLRDSLGLGKI